jgi:integrase
MIVAEALLKRRLGEIGLGKFRGLAIERLTVGEMVQDLFRRRQNGEIKGAKSLEWEQRRWELHLKAEFENTRATSVKARTLSEYIAKRREAGAEPATINRELAVLRRAFRLYREEVPTPIFTFLPEDNARQEFLADDAYPKLAKACLAQGLWLRTMLAVAVGTGWRKGELLAMRVRHVDLAKRRLMLDGSMTKNGKPKKAVINAEMLPLVSACIEGKKLEDPLFDRDGHEIVDMRKAWTAARDAAGLPGFLFHSLRRTFARNSRRMGVSEGVIMAAGGWLTRDIFERYNIKDETDLEDLARRQDEAALRNSTLGTQSPKTARERVQ